MATSLPVRRSLLAFFAWWFALYPAFAVVGATLLPPDPFTQILVVVPAHLVAVAAATALFVRRGGSRRRLFRYALAVYALVLVVGVPTSLVFGAVGAVGGDLLATTLRPLGALAAAAVPYVAGYYLVYEGWYGRLRARYLDGSGPAADDADEPDAER